MSQRDVFLADNVVIFPEVFVDMSPEFNILSCSMNLDKIWWVWQTDTSDWPFLGCVHPPNTTTTNHLKGIGKIPCSPHSRTLISTKKSALINIISSLTPPSSRPDSNPREHDYTVVEFPKSTLLVLLMPGKPRMWVPIPRIMRRCEHNCCSITAFPLQFCRAFTIHKSQGIAIGQGETFKKVILFLPEAEKIQVLVSH